MKHINCLGVFVAAMAVMLFSGSSLCAADAPVFNSISGEISWIDIQSGMLELNTETPNGTNTTAYRITQNETRVTNDDDTKFLSLQDLRAGQYVTIEEIRGQEDKIITKIVVDPMPTSEYSQGFGVLKAIDLNSGTFVVEERVRVGQIEETRLSNFVFDPETIVVMQSPSKKPVELVIKPGDVVRVEYVTINGEQQARYLTLYSPKMTTTTTTTTTVVEQK